MPEGINEIPQAIQEQLAGAQAEFDSQNAPLPNPNVAVADPSLTAQKQNTVVVDTALIDGDVSSTAVATGQDAVPSEPQFGLRASVTRQGEDFEHKYKVVEGKYRAEVPLLIQAGRDKDDEIAQLTEQLEAAEVAVNREAPLDGEALKARYNGIVNDGNLEYGTDLVAMNSRIAQQEAEKVRTEVIERMETMMDRFNSQVGQQSQDVFFDRLEQNLPNWEQIHNSDAFQRFLAKSDPKTRFTNDDLLKEAKESSNVAQAIAIFADFQQSGNNQFPPVAGQVSPLVMGDGAAGVDFDLPILKMSQVEAVYDKINEGGFYTPEREAAILQKIDKAIKDNRVEAG